MPAKIRIRRYHLMAAAGSMIAFGVIGLVFFREGPKPHREESAATAALPQVLSQQSAGPVRAGASRLVQKSAQPKNPVASVRKAKWVALTFDDGPHPKFTERLLKILHDRDVPATFFVVGKQVELHPELLQKIFEEGHELGNHTYSHRDSRTLSGDQMTRELDRTHLLVAAVTDQQMRFFRPPGGQYNRSVVQSAGDLGYTMALWTVFPQDHANPPAEIIRERILKSVQDGGVILLHSGIENTLTVLPGVISELKDRGYSFATLSQMNRRRSAPLLSPFVSVVSAHPKP